MVTFAVHPETAHSHFAALKSSSIIAIIPARFQSFRLPGKALVDICGHPMIEYVYHQTARAPSVELTIVATDDDRVIRAVKSFNGVALLTRSDHVSGTDRLAEVVRDLSCSIVVNVQGDHPLVNPRMIEEAIRPVLKDEGIVMSTLTRRITDPKEFENSHVVKVVADQQNKALYFSRSTIPPAYSSSKISSPVYKHIGIYVYRRELLLKLAGLPQTPLEKAESLEQLRALEHGFKIHIAETEHDTISVDDLNSLQQVRHIVETEGLQDSLNEQGAHAKK